MKICDRCKNTENRASMMLQDVKEGTEYDFCPECQEEFLKFLNPPEARKPGRPRKDGI